ncbi:hypothetical protein DYB34_002789 [Aphanomyces astaci]|uniref:PX domain-containing protein n=1 Tax=Aphanomyces astaci TaxID=112090 RepID=A0A418C1W6_APHAT|nr:hypothetical protein DYB34_002789 [Aphanomyces astaci]
MVFVLTVSQQQNVATTSSWTVYRRLEMFEQLSLSIGAEFRHLNLPPCPLVASANVSNMQVIERCRDDLSRWLAPLLSYPYVNSLMQSRSFIDFISAEANTIPAGLLLSQHFFPQAMHHSTSLSIPIPAGQANIGEMDEFTDMPIFSPDNRSGGGGMMGTSVGRRHLYRDTEGLFQGFTYSEEESYMEKANPSARQPTSGHHMMPPSQF